MGAERQSDLAVMDANEFKQKYRLRRVLESIDEVEQSIQKTEAAYAAGQIDEDGRAVRVLYAVQGAIRESLNLINEDDDIWDTEEIGQVPMQYHEDRPIKGLKGILHADEYITERWMEQSPNRNGPDEREERVAHHTIPSKVSQFAFLELKRYLHTEHNLDLSFETIEVDEEANPF